MEDLGLNGIIEEVIEKRIAERMKSNLEEIESLKKKLDKMETKYYNEKLKKVYYQAIITEKFYFNGYTLDSHEEIIDYFEIDDMTTELKKTKEEAGEIKTDLERYKCFINSSWMLKKIFNLKYNIK